MMILRCTCGSLDVVPKSDCELICQSCGKILRSWERSFAVLDVHPRGTNGGLVVIPSNTSCIQSSGKKASELHTIIGVG